MCMTHKFRKFAKHEIIFRRKCIDFLLFNNLTITFLLVNQMILRKSSNVIQIRNIDRRLAARFLSRMLTV